jgi:hypothetical protein
MDLDEEETADVLRRILAFDDQIEGLTKDLLAVKAEADRIKGEIQGLTAERNQLSHEIRIPPEMPILEKPAMAPEPPDFGPAGDYDLDTPVNPESLPILPGAGAKKPRAKKKEASA